MSTQVDPRSTDRKEITMQTTCDILKMDPGEEATVTLTVNELRCILGAVARDAEHQAARRDRCKQGTRTYYEADYLATSAEIARDAIYRVIGWAD